MVAKLLGLSVAVGLAILGFLFDRTNARISTLTGNVDTIQKDFKPEAIQRQARQALKEAAPDAIKGELRGQGIGTRSGKLQVGPAVIIWSHLGSSTTECPWVDFGFAYFNTPVVLSVPDDNQNASTPPYVKEVDARGFRWCYSGAAKRDVAIQWLAIGGGSLDK